MTDVTSGHRAGALEAGVPALAVGVCQALTAAGHQAFLVGGAIRDLLLGRTASDFDVATSALPDQVTAVFGRRRTIPTGAAHGTVTVLLDKDEAARAGLTKNGIEVTTFRGEGAYSDGRRPESVVFLSDIVEDLRRRDFTINAIAVNPGLAEPGEAGGAPGPGPGPGQRGPSASSWQLVDPFGGRADLAAGIIRAVGDPKERFAEDGLRIMRAVRFAAQLGFALDPATVAAIPGALPVFRKVSLERVRDELLKLLAAPRPSVGLRIMQETGMLAEVIPALVEGVGCAQNRFHAYDVWEHTLHAVDATPGDPVVRLGALLHDVAKPRTRALRDDASGEYSFFRHEIVGAEMADGIGRHLKLSNRDRERVVALVEHHMFWYAPDWSDGAVRRFISRVGEDLLPDLFRLREGDVCGRGRNENPGVELDELKHRIAAELAEQRALKTTDLAVDGRDVMRVLQCPPSAIIGVVLRRILERVIDDPSLNRRELLEPLIPEVAGPTAIASSTEKDRQ